MRKLIYVILGLFIIASCSKSGGGSTPAPAPVPESKIQFTIDADNNSISTGSNFPVVVTLVSAMPSTQGIKIEATVTDQTNNNTIPQNAITSTFLKNTISLTGLPQQRYCTVVIKVSSVATPSNFDTKSFTVIYK